ncbi:hypothetical protein [Myxococcus phage Mx1]|nr:hypothetical protein [Myxococcus phage Mx1]
MGYKPRSELELMTLKELRRYVIDSGYGVTYLGERKKGEIVDIIVGINREKGLDPEARKEWDEDMPHFGGTAPHRYQPGSSTCEYCRRPKDYEPANKEPVQASTLTVPTIHLNGTSAETLFEQYRTVAHALRNARQMLATAYPHGRDYYMSPGTLEKAEVEHESRLARVSSVIAELEELAMHIRKAERERLQS